MVNFEWYRSFVTVYQSGTVTSASELLFLTQPAVSQHITALETMLGTKLFERMPRKMLPTDDGKALYARVISSVNILESTTNEYYREKNKPRSLIRLGSPIEFFDKKILDRIGREEHIYRVTFGSAQSLLEQLEKRKLDIVIATKKESSNKVIEYKKLYVETFVLVQSTKAKSSLREFMKIHHKPPSEALLLQQKWISYDTDLPIIRRYWRDVFKTRPAITPSIIIPNLIMIAKAVEKGKGISVLPSYICDELIKKGKLALINIAKNKNISNEIWIAYRKEDMKNKHIAKVVNDLIISA